MYNAVLLYYAAIIRTIAKKEVITDGKTVMNNAKVMSFPGKYDIHSAQKDVRLLFKLLEK